MALILLTCSVECFAELCPDWFLSRITPNVPIPVPVSIPGLPHPYESIIVLCISAIIITLSESQG